MEVVFYWLGSVIVSLLIVLVGAIYGGIKLGFNYSLSSTAEFWTLLSVALMLLPIVNIVVGIMTACVYVKETKHLHQGLQQDCLRYEYKNTNSNFIKECFIYDVVSIKRWYSDF